MALPLLPAEDIRRAYDWLIQNATPKQRNFFQDLLTYINQQWLSKGTEYFCVFGHKQRTNNPLEAHHHSLRLRMGSHPQMWQFNGINFMIIIIIIFQFCINQ